MSANHGKEASERHANTVGGTVAGPVVQARDLHGGVHVHAAPPPPLPTPSQLPAAGVLAGRRDALTEIDAAHAARREAKVPTLVVVSGPAGIGKTALALHWAHRADFPDGRLFADLRGHAPDGPAEPAEVLGQFIRALGVAPERTPAAPEERVALFRSLVSGRRLVIVLDDARSVQQVDPLLPVSAGSAALVTSRWRLAGLVVRGARIVQLDRLGAEASMDLLGRRLGQERVAAEPVAARRLAELCAGSPLALSVAAARLATRPRWPLGEMVEALTHEHRRLGALSLEDDMTVRAALTLSYAGLPPQAARVYRLLGLHPAITFDSHSAAAAVRLPRQETRRLLGVLADANLLDDVPGGGYRFHDLTRLHARETAEREEKPATRQETVRRALDWFLHTALAANRVAAPYRRLPGAVSHPPDEPMTFADAAAALDWLQAEFRNLRAAARVAFEQGLHPVVWRLVDATWPLFLHRGHYAERLEFERMGVAAARAGGDREAEAKMWNRTGLTLRGLGRLDEAADDFSAALAIWWSLGNRPRIAGGQRRLGLLERDRGDLDAAARRLTEALQSFLSDGESRRAAVTLCDLGEVLIDAGRTAEAARRLTRAGELLRGTDDPYNRARVLLLLGRARTEEPGVAAGLLADALRMMREIGSATGQAGALQALGDLAVRTGHREKAISHYEESRRLLRDMGATTARIDETLSRLRRG